MKDREPLLGRKPAWLAAFEEREQQRIEEADAVRRERDAALAARFRFVEHEGLTYRICRAEPGESVGDWSGMSWGYGWEPLTRFPAWFADARQRRDDAWTVGVVVTETAWRSERIVHREFVRTEAEVAPMMDALAARVLTGEFVPRSFRDRVRNRD